MAIGCLNCNGRFSVGLGDIFSVDDSGNPIDTGNDNGDWSNPFPPTVVTPPYVPPGGGSGFNWGNILDQWTKTGTAIARAQAGANPTYQTTGPGGTTTIYGNPTSAMIPSGGFSLPGGMGIGTIAVLGIGLLLAMKAFK